MDGAACLQVVVADLHLVCELPAAEDEADLVDLNTFLFLKGLLDLHDGVLGLEVVALLPAGQSLN